MCESFGPQLKSSKKKVDGTLPRNLKHGEGFRATIYWHDEGEGCTMPYSAEGYLKMPQVWEHAEEIEKRHDIYEKYALMAKI